MSFERVEEDAKRRLRRIGDVHQLQSVLQSREYHVQTRRFVRSDRYRTAVINKEEIITLGVPGVHEDKLGGEVSYAVFLQRTGR